MTESFDVKVTLTLTVRADKKTFCEKSMEENVQAALDIARANQTLTADGIDIEKIKVSQATVMAVTETPASDKFAILVGNAYFLTEVVCDNAIDRCITSRDPDLTMTFDSEREALEIMKEEPELDGAKVVPF